MVIKASSSREIAALVADLSSDSAVTRDAATARLTVIGQRAVARLVNLAADSTSSALARVAAFRTLEGIGEPRALQPALAAFTDSDASVVVAAVNTAKAFLRTRRGVEALDRVIAMALEPRTSVAVRVAAIQALRELPEATVRPVLAALQADPDPEIENVLKPRQRAAVNTTQRLEAAAAGTLPDSAQVLRSAIARSSAAVPVSVLHQIIEQVRVHEGTTAERRAAWIGTRAAAHLALANRGSRLALYDLRETIESLRERIPVEFLAAVAAIGDATCLEPIAAAYSHARDEWSRRQLADAFRAIIDRETITKRHAVAKKIEKRWPGTWKSIVGSRQ